jgi:hypothetical protein
MTTTNAANDLRIIRTTPAGPILTPPDVPLCWNYLPSMARLRIGRAIVKIETGLGGLGLQLPQDHAGAQGQDSFTSAMLVSVPAPSSARSVPAPPVIESFPASPRMPSPGATLSLPGR